MLMLQGPKMPQRPSLCAPLLRAGLKHRRLPIARLCSQEQVELTWSNLGLMAMLAARGQQTLRQTRLVHDPVLIARGQTAHLPGDEAASARAVDRNRRLRPCHGSAGARNRSAWHVERGSRSLGPGRPRLERGLGIEAVRLIHRPDRGAQSPSRSQ